MMNPSVHLAEDGNPSGRTNPTADDDTVITPTRGEKTRSNNGLKIEKTIKFRFVPPRDKDGVHPAILHAHWMHEVTKAFGEDVKFFDNRNRIVGKVDPLRTNPEEHTLQFQLHFDRHTTQHRSRDRKENSDHLHVTSYIVHRIQTSVSLGELKEAANVIKLMKDHDFYVNEHRWSETDWETTQLGFLYGIDPQFHDIDQATIKVTKTIQQSFPRTKVPKFKLVYCSPKMRKGNGRIVRTKAYAIETMRADREELTKHLKTAYKEDGTFVQYKMRTRHPEAFERFIKAQTQMIATNYVIILNHIGPDAMHYLSDRISAIPGILSLLPCASVNEDGRYKVLVHQKNYHKVRDHLKDVIPKWYDEFVEPDAKAPEYRYPGPPEVSPIESDGDSQGDQSYLTISINTAMSIGSNLSTDSPPIFVYPKQQQSSTDNSTFGGSQAMSSLNGRSWAETARGSRAHSSTDFKSSEESDIQRTLKKDLEISREEVAQLKERLAKIEEIRTQEQARIEEKVKEQVEREREAIDEKVKQQVALALQEQFSTFTQQMTTMFAQMMSTQHHDQSLGKRSATQIQDATTEGEDAHETFRGDDSIKRRDNKKTPTKTPTKELTESSGMWNTPDYLEEIASQSEWSTRSPPPTKEKSTNESALKEQGDKNQMSESEDDDINKQGSRIESTNKSLAHIMELEAHTRTK
ncbi:hypothetical protein MHU86_22956 [Fragilaria crotonensis]|nr:hypothetical protein MHU86_22956 [Fragilaria crotonensis]